MFSLIRLIYRSLFVRGLPLHQVLVGIVLIPAGGLVTWAALNANSNYRYPYFAVFGVVFAIFGVALIIKGIIGFSARKTISPIQAPDAYNGQMQYPQQSQAPYTGSAQYPQQYPQGPYGGSAQYPPQPQAPYAGPAQYPQTPYTGPGQYSQSSQE